MLAVGGAFFLVRATVLAGPGVSTAVVVDRISAGEDKKALAKDYGATEEEIMDDLGRVFPALLVAAGVTMQRRARDH
jgi:hypothetical protein